MSINVITEDRASGAQFIDGSLKIVSSSDTAGSSLRRTPGSEGNRKTWTWSGWVRREKFDTEDALFVSSDSNANSDYTALYFNTSNKLKTTSYQSSSIRWALTTDALFLDIGWYHIVLAVDLNQSTNSNKVKLYVNGSQVTSFSEATYPSTDFETRINSTNDHSIGRASLYERWYADFEMSQVYFIDGQQVGPETFGFTDPLTGTWRPKKFKDENTIAINDGRTWSSYGESNLNGSSSWANVFNGTVPSNNSSYSDVAAREGSGNTSTVTFTPPITGKIRVRISSSASSGTINGSVSLSDGSSVSADIYPNAAKFKEFGYKRNISSLTINAGSNGGCRLSAIEVDGAILKDDTVQKFSPASFVLGDTRPILNTNIDGSLAYDGTRTDLKHSNWILGLAMNTAANIYTDLSPSEGNATDYSNVAASTTQSKFYGKSAYFNGTNAKLIVNDTRFNFSATDFTMETWIYVPSTPTVSEAVFCSSNPDLIGSDSSAGVLVGWNSSNQLFVYVGSDSTPSITNSSTTAVSTSTWHHIAIVKNGGTITLYIDGVASGTTTSSVGNSTSGLYVAYQPANDRWFEAYYQDLRVYSMAKYTANFSPGGVNGFYLPMDGTSPVGKDMSGLGNDWTPSKIGGSNSIDKATGALPILSTTNGAITATVGV